MTGYAIYDYDTKLYFVTDMVWNSDPQPQSIWDTEAEAQDALSIGTRVGVMSGDLGICVVVV
ncbi:hypothetical protein LCGC14_2497120 [marine sediment metagenome]|uniref:Uncharacterized protein n=1 Tax=marine sediment metagenome TaxID=412755 RepID=A0A0F9DWU9_9ZZZZ